MAVALAALSLSACASSTADTASEAGSDVQVVATTAVLGDLARNVVGQDGTVTVLMDGGQDPHTFQLSAAQAASMRDADLIVSNGLGLEAAMADALDQAASEGMPVVAVGDALDPLPVDDDEHDHGPLDPHVWLDVRRMAAAPAVIADALAEVTEGPWQGRADDLEDDLLALDAEVADVVDNIPADCRQVATTHEAMGYFGARYGLRIPVTVVPGTSTEAAPSADDLARGLDVIAQDGVELLVLEDTAGDRLAEVVATDSGNTVEVLSLPLAAPRAPDQPGGVAADAPGGEAYAAMMRTTATGLADALSACG